MSDASDREAISALEARIAARLNRIVAEKDSGFYAAAYAEDVTALLLVNRIALERVQRMKHMLNEIWRVNGWTITATQVEEPPRCLTKEDIDAAFAAYEQTCAVPQLKK